MDEQNKVKMKQGRVGFTNRVDPTLIQILEMMGILEPEQVRKEHEGLFGESANMDLERGIVTKLRSPQEIAFSMRPRAESYGKDISLPAPTQRKPKK